MPSECDLWNTFGPVFEGDIAPDQSEVGYGIKFKAIVGTQGQPIGEFKWVQLVTNFQLEIKFADDGSGFSKSDLGSTRYIPSGDPLLTSAHETEEIGSGTFQMYLLVD